MLLKGDPLMLCGGLVEWCASILGLWPRLSGALLALFLTGCGVGAGTVVDSGIVIEGLEAEPELGPQIGLPARPYSSQDLKAADQRVGNHDGRCTARELAAWSLFIDIGLRVEMPPRYEVTPISIPTEYFAGTGGPDGVTVGGRNPELIQSALAHELSHAVSDFTLSGLLEERQADWQGGFFLGVTGRGITDETKNALRGLGPHANHDDAERRIQTFELGIAEGRRSADGTTKVALPPLPNDQRDVPP